MLFPSLIVALTGVLLFSAGVVLPFVEAMIARRFPARPVERAPLRDDATIDVVIPAYLEAGVIGATIDSLHEQLRSVHGRGRVLVVASDHDTAAVAEAHGAEVREIAPNGKPAAVNAAMLAFLARLA